MGRIWRKLAGALLALLFLCCLCASPVLAAPALLLGEGEAVGEEGGGSGGDEGGGDTGAPPGGEGGGESQQPDEGGGGTEFLPEEGNAGEYEGGGNEGEEGAEGAAGEGEAATSQRRGNNTPPPEEPAPTTTSVARSTATTTSEEEASSASTTSASSRVATTTTSTPSSQAEEEASSLASASVSSAPLNPLPDSTDTPTGGVWPDNPFGVGEHWSLLGLLLCLATLGAGGYLAAGIRRGMAAPAIALRAAAPVFGLVSLAIVLVTGKTFGPMYLADGWALVCLLLAAAEGGLFLYIWRHNEPVYLGRPAPVEDTTLPAGDGEAPLRLRKSTALQGIELAPPEPLEQPTAQSFAEDMDRFSPKDSTQYGENTEIVEEKTENDFTEG